MDTQTLIEVAKNAAINGRWFSALLVLINLHSGHPALAVTSALPIGLGYLADSMYGHPLGKWIAGSCVCVGTLAATLSLLTSIFG